MLFRKVTQNLFSSVRHLNRGHLGMAIHRSPGMRPPSHPGLSLRPFSATSHAARSADLAVSGHVTTDPEDLRRHTSHRWLFDEEMQLAARYVPFDPQALERVASESVGSRCVRINKVAEDDFNRTLLLSFENGREAVARFPYSVLGPTDLIAASEAATTRLVRDIFRLPVPKVLAYSSRARDDTSVGAAYIITDKPPGVPFSAISNHFEPTRREGFIKDIGIMLECSTLIPFSQYGSLYFAEDIEDLPHTTDIFCDPARKLSPHDPQYAIGPSVDWELWRGARQHLGMDRGPWATPLSSVLGMVQCQQTWLKTIPRVRDPQSPAYYNEEDASPAAHIAALDDLLACLPHILPAFPELLFASLGPHYQLGRYVSIDPSHCTVATLTDWQRAVILPYFMQASLPAACDAPPYRVPDGPPDETKVDVVIVGALMKVIKADPKYFTTLESFRRLLDQSARDGGERTINPLSYFPLRTWQHSVLLLQERLVYLQRNWSDFVTDDAPCPLHFSEEESERILHAAGQFTRRAATSWLLALMVGANREGRVPTEKYAEARWLCDEIAKGWFPEDHGPFPFQDGGRSAMNS